MAVFPNAKRLTKDYLEKLEAREASGSGSARHPYDILLDLAMGRDAKGNPLDIPLTVRHLSACACLRVRLPVISKSIQDIQVADSRQQPGVSRTEVLQALEVASPDQIKKIFAGLKPLQLTEGPQS